MVHAHRRVRLAIFFGASVAGGAVLVFGCSSTNPPPADNNTTREASSPVEASAVDGGGDRDIADAAGDQRFSDDGACLDDRPAPTIDGGFTGGDDAGVPVCATSGTCATYCNDVVLHYKLGVAQVAVTCMRQLPDCSNTLAVRLCVENALMSACQDTTALGACTPLVKPCDPNAGGPGSLIDENGCVAFMRGLNPTGRGALASCIQDKISKGTCATEVVECTDQILQ